MSVLFDISVIVQTYKVGKILMNTVIY